jgi:hypothetical protein
MTSESVQITFNGVIVHEVPVESVFSSRPLDYNGNWKFCDYKK